MDLDISEKKLEELDNFESIMCNLYMQDFWAIVNKLPKDIFNAIKEALNEALKKESNL